MLFGVCWLLGWVWFLFLLCLLCVGFFFSPLLKSFAELLLLYALLWIQHITIVVSTLHVGKLKNVLTGVTRKIMELVGSRKQKWNMGILASFYFLQRQTKITGKVWFTNKQTNKQTNPPTTLHF